MFATWSWSRQEMRWLKEQTSGIAITCIRIWQWHSNKITLYPCCSSNWHTAGWELMLPISCAVRPFCRINVIMQPQSESIQEWHYTSMNITPRTDLVFDLHISSTTKEYLNAFHMTILSGIVKCSPPSDLHTHACNKVVLTTIIITMIICIKKQHTLSWISGLAPAFSNTSTTCSWPWCAAQARAVIPYFYQMDGHSNN